MELKQALEVYDGHIKQARKETPEGPWTNEPDRVEFEHAGLLCLLSRGPCLNWCGYVGVPEDHPSFGKNYDDVDVTVHGGLTFGEKSQGHHRHSAETKPLYWFGFDCGHAFDLIPTMTALKGYGKQYGTATVLGGEKPPSWTGKPPRGFEDVYRDLAYVRKETEKLAEQLAAIAKDPSA